MSRSFAFPLLVGAFSGGVAGCAFVADLSQFDGYTDSPGDGSVSDASLEVSAQEPGVDATADAANPSDASETSFFGDGGDLIKNPSCDDGTTYWTTVSGTPLASSTVFVPPGGQHSCHSYDRTHEATSGVLSSYDGPMQDITAAVVPGHEYTVGAWAFWAPSGAMPDSADASGAADSGAPAGADAAAEASPGYEQQNVYITVKETCGTATTYVRVASIAAVPEATWTQVSSSPLTVPVNCAPLDLEMYVEGPDIGLDLYVAGATLVFLD